MKISKSQLRRIIKEEKKRILSERGSGNPALASAERELMNKILDYRENYMLVMGMNPSNPADLKRVRRTIDDLVSTILGEVY